MTFLKMISAAGVLVSLAAPVAAQQSQTSPSGSMSDMKGMSDKGMSDKSMNAFQKDAMAAMDKMNKAMMDGMMDPDAGMAWMKSMAAHHQGAIDMSEVVLKNTKDADIIKEANKTVKENETALKDLRSKMKKEDKKG